MGNAPIGGRQPTGGRGTVLHELQNPRERPPLNPLFSFENQGTWETKEAECVYSRLSEALSRDPEPIGGQPDVQQTILPSSSLLAQPVSQGAGRNALIQVSLESCDRKTKTLFFVLKCFGSRQELQDLQFLAVLETVFSHLQIPEKKRKLGKSVISIGDGGDVGIRVSLKIDKTSAKTLETRLLCLQKDLNFFSEINLSFASMWTLLEIPYDASLNFFIDAVSFCFSNESGSVEDKTFSQIFNLLQVLEHPDFCEQDPKNKYQWCVNKCLFLALQAIFSRIPHNSSEVFCLWDDLFDFTVRLLDFHQTKDHLLKENICTKEKLQACILELLKPNGIGKALFLDIENDTFTRLQRFSVFLVSQPVLALKEDQIDRFFFMMFEKLLLKNKKQARTCLQAMQKKCGAAAPQYLSDCIAIYRVLTATPEAQSLLFEEGFSLVWCASKRLISQEDSVELCSVFRNAIQKSRLILDDGEYIQVKRGILEVFEVLIFQKKSLPLPPDILRCYLEQVSLACHWSIAYHDPENWDFFSVMFSRFQNKIEALPFEGVQSLQQETQKSHRAIEKAYRLARISEEAIEKSEQIKQSLNAQGIDFHIIPTPQGMHFEIIKGEPSFQGCVDKLLSYAQNLSLYEDDLKNSFAILNFLCGYVKDKEGMAAQLCELFLKNLTNTGGTAALPKIQAFFLWVLREAVPEKEYILNSCLQYVSYCNHIRPVFFKELLDFYINAYCFENNTSQNNFCWMLVFLFSPETKAFEKSVLYLKKIIEQKNINLYQSLILFPLFRTQLARDEMKLVFQLFAKTKDQSINNKEISWKWIFFLIKLQLYTFQMLQEKFPKVFLPLRKAGLSFIDLIQHVSHQKKELTDEDKVIVLEITKELRDYVLEFLQESDLADVRAQLDRLFA